MESAGKPTEEELVKELAAFLRWGVKKEHEQEVAELLRLSHVKDNAGSAAFASQLLAAVKKELKNVVDGLDGDQALAMTKLFALDSNQPMRKLAARRVQASRILKLGSQGQGVTDKTFRTGYEPGYLLEIARRLLEREAEASRLATPAIAEPAPPTATRQDERASAQSVERPAGQAPAAPTVGAGAQATATPPPRPWERARASLACLWRRAHWRGAKGISVALLAALLSGVVVIIVPDDEPRTARVLVLIDVSGTMRNYVEGTNPDKVRRIDAAKDFGIAGIVALEQRDRVGVWLVSNSPKTLKDCTWVQRTHCVLQALTPAGDARTDLRRRIASIQANDGGTPLYQAIARGVLELHADRDRGPANAVSSLVVITDGIGKTRRTSGNTESALAPAASAASHSVQVLITAAGQRLCGSKLMSDVRRHFAGICCDARTLEGIKAANTVIRGALSTRLKPPGSRPAKCQEQALHGS